MADATLGFIGLGVMGAPMCRNLARKSGRPVVAFDLHQPPPDDALPARSVKLLNNMVLSVTVLALAEALAVQAAGTARRMLEDTVALGLGDAYHTAVVEAVRKQAG